MNSSRGRPRGGGDGRERLLSAAREVFFDVGYRSGSAREVARRAGVDHTLVNYHFGSKQALFGAAMALEFSPGTAVERVLTHAEGKSPRRVAEELLATILALWDHDATRPALMEVIDGIVTDPATRDMMSEFIAAEVLMKVRAHIGGADAGARAAAVSTVTAGMIFTRYFLRVEPLASMPARDVVRALAPMVALQLGGRSSV